jgi:hypothetical protein
MQSYGFANVLGLRWERMRKRGVVSERLRDYVRARVRKDGKFYEWGNGVRLAEHLQVDSGWVTTYTDKPPTAHATIDQAIAICEFFAIDLDTLKQGPGLSLAGSTVGTIGGTADDPSHQARLLEQEARIRELEAALDKTHDVALQLVKVAAIGRQGRAAAGRKSRSRGRHRKTS